MGSGGPSIVTAPQMGPLNPMGRGPMTNMGPPGPMNPMGPGGPGGPGLMGQGPGGGGGDSVWNPLAFGGGGNAPRGLGNAPPMFPPF